MKEFWIKSSFIRSYLWKYRKSVSVGIAALILVDILEIFPPLILKGTIDHLTSGGEMDVIYKFAAAYFFVSVFQSICRYAWRMYIIRTSMWAGRDIRNRFANHLFRLSASFYDRNRVGDLMSLATNDTEAVRRAMGPGLIVFADAVFYMLTVPIAMIILSPKLTALTFIPMVFIPFIVFRNEKLIHKRFEKVQETFSHLSSLAQENLMGIRVVKAFAKENAQLNRFARSGLEYLNYNMKLARIQSGFGPSLDFIMSTGMVMLIYFGGFWVSDDSITIGTFVAFQRYIQKMIWPMEAIGLSVVFFQRGTASSERVLRILSEKSDIVDPDRARYKEPKNLSKIEFKNLRFRYPGAEKWVLDGLNLTVEPGMRVAILGSIGSGKSSLLSIIPRFYPVERDQVFLGGIDINDWPKERVRALIGYVPQDLFLFSESVSENIAFGLPDFDGTSEHHIGQVDRVAKLCSVKVDIDRLSGGFDTKLGERGVNLSGGQKQRLTLSRAIIKEPSVLILDDALSAVDVETESNILKALKASRGSRTELIAAHRISTVQDADLVVVLEEGKIADQGTHAKLIRKKTGLYYRFYEQQRLKEELDQFLEGVSS